MAGRLDRRRLYLSLVEQIMDECGADAWFTMQDESGRPHDHQYGAIHVPAPLRVWARDLCAALNKHVDFDGAWIVAWGDPVMVEPPLGIMTNVIGIPRPIPSRAVWMHKDADGDVNFAVDTEDSLRDILGSDILERVEHAAVARQEYLSMLRDIGVDARHMRKAALGEAPRDPRIKVVPFA